MIELQAVTKYYPTPHGRKYVFRDLSFRFPSGASIGVLGPNGAGKSTLLRMLGGIESPNRGRIVSDELISWPVGLSGGFQGSLSGRDNATITIVQLIYSTAFQFGRYGLASAMAVVLFIMAVAVAVVQFRSLRSDVEY